MTDEHMQRPLTFRRCFLALMQHERYLAARVAAGRARGERLDFAARECAATHWAIEELDRLYPEPAARARGDLFRDEERRRARGGQQG